MKILSLPINDVEHDVKHLPVSPKAGKAIAALPLESSGLSALFFPGKPISPTATSFPGLQTTPGSWSAGLPAGKPRGAGLASILSGPSFTLPLSSSWQQLGSIPPAAGEAAFDLSKTLLALAPRGKEVPARVDGIGVLVAGTGLWPNPSGLPQAGSNAGLSSLGATVDLALAGVKAVADSLPVVPPGVDAPIFFDGIAGFAAAFSLLRGPSQTASHDEKVLFYSSNACDIANFVIRFVPVLHSLGMPLSVIGFAMKCGQSVRTFSVTPRSGMNGAIA